MGFIFIPTVLAFITFFIQDIADFDTLLYYFRAVFLIIYLSFPILYRKEMPKLVPNRYAFYALLYLIFGTLGIILALYT